MPMDMKRGDRAPSLKLVAEDADAIANLNQVTAWRIIGRHQGQIKLDAAPDTAVVDPGNQSKATLTRVWLAGETDLVGDMAVEAEATYSDGRKQTFPANGYEYVRFHPDLA